MSEIYDESHQLTQQQVDDVNEMSEVRFEEVLNFLEKHCTFKYNANKNTCWHVRINGIDNSIPKDVKCKRWEEIVLNYILKNYRT